MAEGDVIKAKEEVGKTSKINETPVNSVYYRGDRRTNLKRRSINFHGCVDGAGEKSVVETTHSVLKVKRHVCDRRSIDGHEPIRALGRNESEC